MKSIAIISGKGGTGKTSITAALAWLARPVVVADADVDAADLHLLLKPRVEDGGPFHAGFAASIDPELCTRCGACVDACAYRAIDASIHIDPLACEGCGVCEFVCPHGAASLHTAECGEWFVSASDVGPMAHAKLSPGKENSGRLVSLVRTKAAELCEKNGIDLMIVDGPPGVGCPVIAAIGGVDAVLIVVEPTVAGLHDAERAIDLAKHFRIPAAVLINKYTIHEETAQHISDVCQVRGVPLAGKIPYTTDFTTAQLAGTNVVAYGIEDLSTMLQTIWHELHTIFTL